MRSLAQGCVGRYPRASREVWISPKLESGRRGLPPYENKTIRDRVQLGTGGEGWVIHTDGSLRYRGPVVVSQLVELRDETLREFNCSRFCSASRWHEDV